MDHRGKKSVSFGEGKGQEGGTTRIEPDLGSRDHTSRQHSTGFTEAAFHVCVLIVSNAMDNAAVAAKTK